MDARGCKGATLKKSCIISCDHSTLLLLKGKVRRVTWQKLVSSTQPIISIWCFPGLEWPGYQSRSMVTIDMYLPNSLYHTHAHAVTSLMAPRQAAIRGVHPCSLSSFSSPFCTPSSVSPFLHPLTISQSDLCEHEPKKSTVSELWVRADCYFHRYLEKKTRWRNYCKHAADRYYQALSARCLWQSLCLCDY